MDDIELRRDLVFPNRISVSLTVSVGNKAEF